MRLGTVTGKVWASAKDPQLNGFRLAILQPVDEQGAVLGTQLVAVDTIGTREGDLVAWVTGAEATFVGAGKQIPSDVTIVSLIDRLDQRSAP